MIRRFTLVPRPYTVEGNIQTDQLKKTFLKFYKVNQWRLLAIKSCLWGTIHLKYSSLKRCATGHAKQTLRVRLFGYPIPDSALTPVPLCLTHLHDDKSLVHSGNGILYDSRSRFHWYVALECGYVYSQCTRSLLGSRSLQRRPVWLQFSCPHPVKQWTYVDGALEPVILQLCIMTPWILVARMYHRLPLGNFQMPRNVKATRTWTSGESVKPVLDYERCFSQDHRTTNWQGNLWSLYQNRFLTWRRSRLSIRLNVH